MNPIFFEDFYKIGHVDQYPKDTEYVFSNWTPRSSRIPGQTNAVFFGLQYFLKEYLIDQWNANFFRKKLSDIIREYKEVMRATLGLAEPRTDHIEALHKLGYLPLRFYAIPEGFSTPLNVPPFIVTNTLPQFYWLPNFFESIPSCALWKASTSATRALRFRRVFEKWAREAGEEDLGFVDWQGHDFSFRGMSGLEDAILSGMGHLLSFSGTDTIPAIIAAKKYYGADYSVGGSVPATEHSVMSAGTKEGEFDTFKRIITEIYPTGTVSIVSDTWDLWKVLTDFVPRLKKEIQSRSGKLVIRPDSGDPVKIMCGDDAMKGVTHRYTGMPLSD